MLQHNIDHLEVLFPAVLMFPQKTHPKTKQKKPTKNIAPEYWSFIRKSGASL